jgi:hypothetical protein
MGYTPNPTWESNTIITTQALDNLETQYDESYSYLTTHNHDTDFHLKADMDSTYWNAENTGPGSGSDADLLYHSGGNKHASDFAGLGVTNSIVIMWYGSIESIPPGWHLCDGSNGTPDLRDKFILGAGGTYNPGQTGGSTTFSAAGTITIDAHVLTIDELGPHRHPFLDNYSSAGALDLMGTSAYALGSTSGTTPAAGGGGGHTHSTAEGTSFTGSAVACMPYYYALAFIMKT